ncbi:GGDEF and EAL domain-containing protein [uncultured Thiodictyon sp.]|uniref:putative bifunctional diguanylate cyclase/phosphodiesterase n=1 Tax=uncultured Thiodictyon sp. TaxID=1846217 RepID=UPI0025FE70A7|nr:GGDEF and EAL domain-containing protein [uncultured Thiodictyon sp.]
MPPSKDPTDRALADPLSAPRRETPDAADAAPLTPDLADVIEVVRTRPAILAAPHFLRSVIDGVGNPIMAIDTDYRLLLMNQAAQRAIGGLREELGGLTCYRAIHGRTAPCDSPDHPCPVPQVLAGATAVKVVHCNLWADAAVHWIEVIASPLLGPAGEVLGVVKSWHDITDHRDLTAWLKERERQLEHLVQHDPLTGLPNRLLFADRLHQAMHHANRESRKVAVLFVDLDRFKAINDSLGHAAGDQVLKQAAGLMRGLVREGDTVARLGGDEFIVVLEALADGSSAGLVADKLLAAFRAPFVVEGRALRVTTSIGISVYPDDGADVDALVRNADSAMYRAKAQGRDTFRFYTQAMTARAIALVSLETDLQRALADGEFALHYQPQIELATGRIAGLEALLRWRHPVRGLIEPTQFVPVAESTGLIVPISAWVVRTAATQMKAWRDQGLLTDAAIWINLSSGDMRNPSLAESIADIVGEAGLEINALAVEIAGTWIMANAESAPMNILRLQAQGIEVGIDDFGAGYSSLAVVQRLSVRELKIDRLCVAGLPDDADACSMARAVIALGDALGLRVVAEGVETPIQADFLKAEGCRIAQGYLFSWPLAAAQFEVYARSVAA